ncbi:hypothetical protein M3Y99_01647100 [Aphelenchoides fujianensis]|nr:hypothetical protein M3Y99_01647100 [Aphelenchoides fujianensis]
MSGNQLMLVVVLVAIFGFSTMVSAQKSDFSAQRKFNRPFNPFAFQNNRWHRGRRESPAAAAVDVPLAGGLGTPAAQEKRSAASYPWILERDAKDKKSPLSSRMYGGRPVRNPYSWLNNNKF